MFAEDVIRPTFSFFFFEVHITHFEMLNYPFGGNTHRFRTTALKDCNYPQVKNHCSKRLSDKKPREFNYLPHAARTTILCGLRALTEIKIPTVDEAEDLFLLLITDFQRKIGHLRTNRLFFLLLLKSVRPSASKLFQMWPFV